MNLIELQNISKIYKTNDEQFYALNHITLSFPSSGLIAIVGQSGSGKTTLLNMISLFDKPTEGDVFISGINTSKWNNKKVNAYRKNILGYISQNYNLIEDQTLLYNIMLPSLINGVKKSKAKEDALILLNKIKIPHKLYNQKVCNLSGGEKERTAILRSLMNNPKILIADEPTGALDSFNSITIMEMLKKISEKRLVIVVSHNDLLVEKYADRIIHISDGKVITDLRNKEENNGQIKEHNKVKTIKDNWTTHFLKTNLHSRMKRNFCVSMSLIVCILSTLLISGFSYNSSKAIQSTVYKHLDYGSAYISKEKIIQKSENGMSISQSERPDIAVLRNNDDINEKFYINQNYDSLLTSNYTISYKNENLRKIIFSPIYSFSGKYIDIELLKDGNIPKSDSVEHIVINEKMKELLDGEYRNFPIQYDCKFEYEYNFNGKKVFDTFSLSKKFVIDGVVDELSFLSTPTIYYCYRAFDQLIENTIAEEISDFVGKEISWKDVIKNSSSHNVINSFSYRLFLKDRKDILSIKLNDNDDLSLTSNPLLVNGALMNIINAANVGMWAFIVIAIAGVILILAIVSLSAYSNDRKKNAILLSLGASFNSISSVYVSESLLIGFLSAILASFFSIFFEYATNAIIENTTGIKSLIKIPWENFLGYKWGFPIMIFAIILAVSLLSTVIPIMFSRKISLKEELKSE